MGLTHPPLSAGPFDQRNSSLGREISPGEMPDGTHRRSIAEGATSAGGMPAGHHFGRKTTGGSQMDGGEKSGFREKLKDKFRSKK